MKKGILLNFISRASLLVSTFLLNLLFARLLGASRTGELYYTVNNLSIISLVASLSLESSMTFFLAKKEISEKELVSISLAWSVLGAVIATIVFFQFQAHGDASKFYTVLYCLSFVLGTLLSNYFSGLFFARQQFSYPHLVPAVVNAGLFFYGLIFLQQQPIILQTAYFLSFGVSGIVLCFLYLLKYSVRIRAAIPSTGTFKKLYRYSSLALIANISAFLAYRVDYWILKSFPSTTISETALGNYIQVSKLIQLFLFVPTIVATIVFPTTAATVDFNYKDFKKVSVHVLTLNSILCIALSVFGRRLFVYLFGESFSLMFSCFMYSIPVVLCMSVIRILSSYFAGVNKIRYNLIGCIATFAIVVTMNLLLVPYMGINGSAAADSVGYFGYLVILLYFLKKYRRSEKHFVVD